MAFGNPDLAQAAPFEDRLLEVPWGARTVLSALAEPFQFEDALGALELAEGEDILDTKKASVASYCENGAFTIEQLDFACDLLSGKGARNFPTSTMPDLAQVCTHARAVHAAHIVPAPELHLPLLPPPHPLPQRNPASRLPQALCQLLGRSRGEKGNIKSALDGPAQEAALSNDESDGGESDGGDDCETQPRKWRVLVETVNQKVATPARGKHKKSSSCRHHDCVTQ